MMKFKKIGEARDHYRQRLQFARPPTRRWWLVYASLHIVGGGSVGLASLVTNQA